MGLAEEVGMSVLLKHALNLTGAHKHLHISSMLLSPTVAGAVSWFTQHPFHFLSIVEAKKLKTCLPNSFAVGSSHVA